MYLGWQPGSEISSKSANRWTKKQTGPVLRTWTSIVVRNDNNTSVPNHGPGTKFFWSFLTSLRVLRTDVPEKLQENRKTFCWRQTGDFSTFERVYSSLKAPVKKTSPIQLLSPWGNCTFSFALVFWSQTYSQFFGLLAHIHIQVTRIGLVFVLRMQISRVSLYEC